MLGKALWGIGSFDASQESGSACLSNWGPSSKRDILRSFRVERLTINSRKAHAAFLGRNKTACTLRLQGREAGAVHCAWEPALHCLGWVKRIVLVLKVKENWSERMGEAEGCCSGVRPAVAQAWAVGGRAQWVSVVERPTAFYAAQVMS